MRLEQIPVLLGVLVAIVGLGLVLDAQLPEGFSPGRERRRRQRAQRHRGGETLVGLGIAALAAALIGTDRWRFGTVAILLGAVLLAAGGWLNRQFLRELLLFRGPARRGEKRRDPARRAAGVEASAAASTIGRPDAAGARSGASVLADTNRARHAGASAPNGGQKGVQRPADREAPIRVANERPTGGNGSGGEDAGDPSTRLRSR